jgi:hypothetical protein
VVRWRGLVGGGGKLRRLAAVRSGCIHTSKREEKKRNKEGVGAEVERKRWKEATGTRGVVLCCHLLSRIERTRSPHHPGDFHKADRAAKCPLHAFTFPSNLQPYVRNLVSLAAPSSRCVSAWVNLGADTATSRSPFHLQTLPRDISRLHARNTQYAGFDHVSTNKRW